MADREVWIHPQPPLRFVLRSGQMILQQQCIATERRFGMVEREETVWLDVPLAEEIVGGSWSQSGSYRRVIDLEN